MHRVPHCLSHADEAVPIGVCLHNRKDLGAADFFADHIQIMTERASVDLGPAAIGFFRVHFVGANPRGSFGVVMWGSRR
jgi:hypothetical protein